MKPYVSIGIPTYNGAFRVDYLLQSIARSIMPNEYDIDIILLDDGSSNKMSVKELTQLSLDYSTRLITHKENYGIPTAWNNLCNEVDSDIKILLNDDILVPPVDWLTPMVYFLLENEVAGAAGWNFDFITYNDVPSILTADNDIRIPRDARTKKMLDKDRIKIHTKPGKMMCAVGCCFGFTKEKFEMFGGFDENIVSFHEESLAMSILTKKGYPSFMLPSPTLYHIWSTTFNENPELQANKRLVESRRYYCNYFDVPDKYRNNPFEYTDPLFMSKIKPSLIKWLDKDGNKCEEVI